MSPARSLAVPAELTVAPVGLPVVPVESHAADVTLHPVPLGSHDFSTPSQGGTAPFPHDSLALQLVTLPSIKPNVASTSPTITARDSPRIATDANGSSHLRTLTPTSLDAASKHFSTGSTLLSRSFHSKEYIEKQAAPGLRHGSSRPGVRRRQRLALPQHQRLVRGGPVTLGLRALFASVLIALACSESAPAGDGNAPKPPDGRPPNPSSSHDWTRFGYDAARSSASPDPTGLDSTNVGTLKVQQIALDGTVDASPIYLHAVQVNGAAHDASSSPRPTARRSPSTPTTVRYSGSSRRAR